MAIYYCLVISTIIYSFLNKRVRFNIGSRMESEYRDRTALFFFLFLLVMLVLRSDTCGTDLVNYERAFNSFKNAGFSWTSLISLKGRYGFESGYILLNLLIGSLTDNFQIFMAVVAILSVIPIMYLYYKESDNGLLTISAFLLFGLISMYFSGLRQVLAMAFVVPAYYCAKEKKFVKFLVFVVLAFFFHKSAMVMILIYPLLNIKITKQHLLIIVPVVVAMLIFNKQLFGLLTNMFGYDASMQSTGAYSILILLLIFVVYSFVCVDESIVDESFNGLRNILIFSLVIQLFAPLNNIAMRMNYYNLLLVPITLSKVENYASDNFKQVTKIGTFIMTAFFLVYYLITISPGDIMHIYPYVAMWNG